MFLLLFLRFPIYFLSFFPFVMEKEEKTCFNTEPNYFDQQTGQNTQQTLTDTAINTNLNSNSNV